MEKPIRFLPNRMDFNIQRVSNDNFSVEYTEYYDYLPNEVAEVMLTALMDTLQIMGVKGYSKVEKGIKLKYSGTFFQILTVMLTDLLNHTKQIDFDNLTSLIKDIHTFRHKHAEFESEWNKQIEQKLTEIGNKILKNPLTI